MSFGAPAIERFQPRVGDFHNEASAEGARYDETVNRMARAFIYDKVPTRELTEKLTRLKDARTGDRAMAAFEEERGQLEAVLHFCRGVELHERANKIHGGPWQKNLIDQPATRAEKPRPPETLTRDQVAAEFTAFDLGVDLVTSEQQALSAYRDFLASSEDPMIPLSRNIKIQRVDVQALLNDLEVRIAERIPDEEVRRTRLLELNRELLELIQAIPKEDAGKRFELQEIYLLRRLIQTAGTGHIVSVNHGTPRQDLNIDQASVDLVITFAGRIDLQIKTYKARVSSETLRLQRKELEYRAETLEGTETQLTVLQGEAVKECFEATLRQREDQPTRLRDKQVVFAPLLEKLNSVEGARLKILLGLTEERCEAERLDFERRQASVNQSIREVLARKRREAELAKQAEEAKRVAAQNEVDRLAKIRASEEQTREESARERTLREAAKIAHREAKKRAREEAEKAAAEARAALRKPRGWAVRPLETLCDAPTLRRFGFLKEGEVVTIDGLKAAKEVFWKVLPPDVFFELFPEKKKFDKPSQERMKQIRERHDAYLARIKAEAEDAGEVEDANE